MCNGSGCYAVIQTRRSNKPKHVGKRRVCANGCNGSWNVLMVAGDHLRVPPELFSRLSRSGGAERRGYGVFPTPLMRRRCCPLAVSIRNIGERRTKRYMLTLL